MHFLRLSLFSFWLEPCFWKVCPSRGQPGGSGGRHSLKLQSLAPSEGQRCTKWVSGSIPEAGARPRLAHRLKGDVPGGPGSGRQQTLRRDPWFAGNSCQWCMGIVTYDVIHLCGFPSVPGSHIWATLSNPLRARAPKRTGGARMRCGSVLCPFNLTVFFPLSPEEDQFETALSLWRGFGLEGRQMQYSSWEPK